MNEGDPGLVLSRECLVLCDAAGQITWADERAQRLLRAQAGRRVADLVMPESRAAVAQLIATAGREPASEVLAVCGIAGAPRYVLLRGAPHAGGVLLAAAVLSRGCHDRLADLRRSIKALGPELTRTVQGALDALGPIQRDDALPPPVRAEIREAAAWLAAAARHQRQLQRVLDSGDLGLSLSPAPHPEDTPHSGEP
jgi:hypothetical protein